MQTTLGWGEILLRLILAATVGLILGYNRTERGHPAGLRTMLLVSVAAALAMIEANILLASTQGDWNQVFRLDVMRLPLGILSGIGFIGAGTILRRGDLIRGLTTAATIWFVTVIGLCLGGGQLGLGLAGAAVGFVTLSMLGWLEGFMQPMLGWLEGFMQPDLRGSLRVLIATGGPSDEDLRVLLRRQALSILGWQLRIDKGQEQMFRYDVKFRAKHGAHPARRLLRELTATPGVVNVEFQCLEN